MSPAISTRGVFLGARMWFWRRPEWWVIAIGIGCWVLLLVPLANEDHSPHARHHLDDHAVISLSHWTLMIGAMMLPLLVGQIRIVADRSLWGRRNRAIAMYLVGYSLTWMLYGAVVVEASRAVASPVLAAAAGLIMAAVWQVTPWKARGLRGCHRTGFMSPVGWQADMDCVRLGSSAGTFCLVSCWALMLPCAFVLSEHWVMPAIMAFMYVERVTDRPRHGRFAAVLAVAALAVAWSAN